MSEVAPRVMSFGHLQCLLFLISFGPVKPQHDPLITLNEVASLLGITPYRVQKLINEGRLKPVTRPGLNKPGYRRSEAIALKAQIYPGGQGGGQ